MAYTVTITYNGVESAVDVSAAPICRIFAPTNSYIDTPVYTDGGPIGEQEQVYDKSIYATNIDGFGHIEVAEPFASTSIPMSAPLAQFKLATVADEGTDGKKVTFEVEDYKEAFYYMQLGEQMKDQGFEVSVSKN